MTSVITNKEELLSVVRKEYHNDSVEFSSAFFDFEVQMPVPEILDAYAELCEELNGDVVEYPTIKGVSYTGNCAEFLLSMNRLPKYVRRCGTTGETVDFAM